MRPVALRVCRSFQRLTASRTENRSESPQLFTGSALSTYALLRALGPDATRYGIVAFDDFPPADVVSPAVTVVVQDPGGMGRTATEMLSRFQAACRSRWHAGRNRGCGSPGMRSARLRLRGWAHLAADSTLRRRCDAALDDARLLLV